MDQAVHSGDLKRVQELIWSGADVNRPYEDSPLLHLAIWKGHVDIALAKCMWDDSSLLGLFGGESKRRTSAHRQKE